MKTVSAALVMCLNIGVDPPDVVKTSQCSKLECWISEFEFFFIRQELNPRIVIIINEIKKKDQTLMTPQKALEMIGIELQKQYERWQPRARYKHCLDPTSDDVKKLCISLRKNAKVKSILSYLQSNRVEI